MYHTSLANFTQVGYQKFCAPTEIFQKIRDFYNKNKDKEVFEGVDFVGNTMLNYWKIEQKSVAVYKPELEGGGLKFAEEIYDALFPIVTEWIEAYDLVPSSMVGIRIYKEGAILNPHVDHPDSAAAIYINVDQDPDANESWPLEVIGHDGIARNITLDVGDMLLIESNNVIHGRPFALQGTHVSQEICF